MSQFHIEHTAAMTGSGAGPTLADLREFVDKAGGFSPSAKVRFTHHSDQREGDYWRIEIKGDR